MKTTRTRVRSALDLMAEALPHLKYYDYETGDFENDPLPDLILEIEAWLQKYQSSTSPSPQPKEK